MRKHASPLGSTRKRAFQARTGCEDSERDRALLRRACFLVHENSETEYNQKEIAHVLDESKRHPEGTIVLFPVKRDPCELPDRMSRCQWVDLANSVRFKRQSKVLVTIA